MARSEDTVTKFIPMRRRVVIVDPHTSVREMLAAMLSQEAHCDVVGEAGSGREGLALCERLVPNLVIFELALPEVCGTELLRRIQAKQNSARTFIYSGATGDLRIKGLHGQPHGFVTKFDPLLILREAVRVVVAGGIYISASLDCSRNCNHAPPDHLLTLTDREREILQMVAESYSSKEIAARLNLSTKTVENHRLHIMEKLNRHDTAALTRFAMQEGLVH